MIRSKEHLGGKNNLAQPSFVSSKEKKRKEGGGEEEMST